MVTEIRVVTRRPPRRIWLAHGAIPPDPVLTSRGLDKLSDRRYHTYIKDVPAAEGGH